MSVSAPGMSFFVPELGDIAKDLSVQAAILDRFGVIVSVNDQWKRFAEVSGLAMPDYGIGENYLRHCAFADPLSPRLIRGLSQVIFGEINRLSVVYSCDSADDSRKTWFLLLAFPYPESPDHVAVMHVDVTVLVSVFSMYRKNAAADDMTGDQSGAPGNAPGGAAEQAIIAMFTKASDGNHPAGGLSHRRAIKDPRSPPLSKRQMEVLGLMAKGMTNADIAQQLGLSLNTVKVYVSGILARLGLQSRAQVLHWALTRRNDDADV